MFSLTREEIMRISQAELARKLNAMEKKYSAINWTIFPVFFINYDFSPV
jgi:hypothetical protein